MKKTYWITVVNNLGWYSPAAQYYDNGTDAWDAYYEAPAADPPYKQTYTNPNDITRIEDYKAWQVYQPKSAAR